MVALSRCLGSLVSLVGSAVGIRIAKGKVQQDCYSKYDGKALLQLKPCSPEEAVGILSQLEKSGCVILDEDLEILQKGCSGNEAVCSKQAAMELANITTLFTSDVGAHWRQSSGNTAGFAEGLGAASAFYSAWRDLDAQNSRVEALVHASGGVATLETVGQSLQGRDLRIVRFRGAGYRPGGTRVVVTYNMHAREWISGMAGVYQVEQLIQKVKQDANYLAGVEVVAMPMANPDGFLHSTRSDRMHRKNMRGGGSCIGVDLNRNWDIYHGWLSSNNPCSDTYHGTGAASEPETRAYQQLLNETRTTVYMDIHSYGELIISAWAYTGSTHPRNSEYRAMGGSIQSAIMGAGGNRWWEGAIAQGLYAASGSSVDYADKLGALGVCLELPPGGGGSGGFAPPASSILPGARQSYAGFLAAVDYAKRSNPSPTPTPPAPTPTPPGPTPPTPPTPTPTPPTPPTPTPIGGCVHEKDCDVSPWCTNTGLEVWCQQQGQSGACPAPQCKRV